MDELDADDLASLADALFWLDQPGESAATWHRAFLAYQDAGDVPAATMAAWRAFFEHFQIGERARASGWLERLRNLVSERADTVEAGYVAVAEAGWAHVEGDLEAALEHAERATELGRIARDHNLTSLAAETSGRILVDLGRVVEGVRLLDDVMVSVVGGELDALFTGWIYCEVLSVCRDLADIDRASEWTDAAMGWCDQLPDGRAYTGICRVHRAELTSWRGEWVAAEDEIARACDELMAVDPRYAGEAFYVAGELYRVRGDHVAAERAYQRSHELGRSPQPGLALLRLAQGDVETAVASVRRVVGGGSFAPLPRAQLLAARVECELEVEDVDAARVAADELADLVEEHPTLYLGAIRDRSLGAVALAEDDVETALDVLTRSREAFMDLGMPFDAARAQVLVGIAARRAGDNDSAKLDLTGARAVFTRLGAAPSLEGVEALLASGEPRPGGLTDRQLEVLRLVARGRTDREIAAALVLSEHTVARHVSNIRTKLGVPSRAAATAFAYEHDLL